MQFTDFCDYVCENIGEYLPEYNDVEAQIRDTTKNNGVELKSLCVRDENMNEYGSNIYLEYYYREYMEKVNIEHIMEEIAEEYRRSRDQIIDCGLEVEDFTEPDLDRIVVRVINYDRNRDMLENCPYIKYQDLAITFRQVGRVTERDMMSILVDNKMMAKLDMTPQELYHIAVENYNRTFPPALTSLGNVLSGLLGDMPDFMLDDTPEKNIYVLSNKQNINGATSMLVSSMMDKAAEELGENYYVLPSSTHEVLLVPESFAREVENLTSMVYEINRSVVNEMDFLSDTVYHYDAENRKLTMVNPPENLTKDLEETRSEELEISEEEREFDDLDEPPFKQGR